MALCNRILKVVPNPRWRHSCKKRTATSTGPFPYKQFSTACAPLLLGPAPTLNSEVRFANFRANRCLKTAHQTLLLAKFASNAPNYWSAAAVKLFWESRASKWRGETTFLRWNSPTEHVCSLENISPDVALQVTVRSGILNFRRGHG